MPWLPLYLVREDIETLNEWLNQEEELAFLLKVGPHQWKAFNSHTIFTDISVSLDQTGFPHPNRVEYQLWHISSGPLPLLMPTGDEEMIDNPWLGWQELSPGANTNIPYFGAGHCGVFKLQIQLPRMNEIALSGFQWIGNHYNQADPATKKLWNKIRAMAKKIGKRIPRQNDLTRQSEVYAFPQAYVEIMKGRPCALN